MFTSEPIETAPVLALAPQDRDTRLHERRASHVLDRPLLQRREQREWSATYRPGLWLELPRKSIEPMVLALEGANRNTVRAMQQFLREGAWDADTSWRRHGPEVDHTLGDDKGVLPVDGRDFPQQGSASVGVQRQDGGELGTRAHCQAGVFLG
jgi:SRSO17 transposase